jgi:hypothetical protein
MRTLLWAGLLTAGCNVVLAGSTLAANMMPDVPFKKGNVRAVCNGVGSAKQDSRWASYSVRLAFTNRASQYIVGEHVVLSQAGRQIVVLDCGAPWILLTLPAGSYSLKATLPDQAGVLPRGATIVSKDGASKQRVGIMFPELQPNE